MQPERLSISALAGFYGVSLRTLRFYEQRGLLRPTRIGTRRLYTGRDRITLELILKGKRLGFSLLEIERLIAATPGGDVDSPPLEANITQRLNKEIIRRQLEHLERKREEVEQAIAELKEGLRRQE